MNIRLLVRIALALIYLAVGAAHFLNPGPLVSIVPPWVPAAPTVVTLTGIAEVLGAIGLLQPFSPRLCRAAGWGLAAYALCVWPANVQHMLLDLAKPDHGMGLGYHIPRLAAQPLVIWAALWASKAIDWPFGARLRAR